MNEYLYSFLAAVPKADVNIPKPELDETQMGGLLTLVFGVAAAVAVIFIVLGGIKYSISQGNASDLQKAKDMIVYALVGLVIVMFGFTIVQFVTANLF